MTSCSGRIKQRLGIDSEVRGLIWTSVAAKKKGRARPPIAGMAPASENNGLPPREFVLAPYSIAMRELWPKERPNSAV